MKDNKNIEKTEDTENSRKKAAVMIFGREIPKKKAIIGTCALVIALVLIGGVCLTVALHSQKPEKANQSDINTNETVSENTGNPAASKNNPGSGNGGISNRKPGGNGGNSGFDSNSGGSSGQVHTHNWVPVTKTVHHDAQYKTVYVCNNCGEQFDTDAELDAHMKAHFFDGCQSYHTAKVVT